MSLKIKFKYHILILILLLLATSRVCISRQIDILQLHQLFKENDSEYEQLTKEYELKKLKLKIDNYLNLDKNNKLEKLKKEITLLETERGYLKTRHQSFDSLYTIYYKYNLSKANLEVLKSKSDFEGLIVDELKQKYKDGLVTLRELNKQKNKLKKIRSDIEKENYNLQFLKKLLNEKLKRSNKEKYNYKLNNDLENVVFETLSINKDIKKDILVKQKEIVKLKIKRAEVIDIPTQLRKLLEKKLALIKKSIMINKTNKGNIKKGYQVTKDNFIKSYKLSAINIKEAEEDNKIMKKEYSLGLVSKKELLKTKIYIRELYREKSKIILDYYQNYLNYKGDLL